MASTEIDSQSSSSSSPSSGGRPNSSAGESPRISSGRLFDSSGAFSPKPTSSPSTRRSNSSLGPQHMNGQRTPTKMLLNSSSAKRMLEREESDLDMTITAQAPIVVDDDDSDEEQQQLQMPRDRRIIQQQSVESVEEVSFYLI